MKQAIPTPIIAIVLVALVAVVGFFVYRGLAGPAAAGAASTAASGGPGSRSPFMKKPDFSKMTPEQIQAMRGGNMGAMMRGGGSK